MLRINVTDEKPLNWLFGGIISIFFAVMILQYDYKAVALLILMSFVLVFFIRVEYTFYFLLASRGIVEVFCNVQATESVKITQYLSIIVTLLFSSYFIISRYHIFRIGINKAYGIFIILSSVPVYFTQNLIAGFGSWLKFHQGFLVLNMTVMLILKAKGISYKNRINIIIWCIIIYFFIPFILYIKNYLQGTHVEIAGRIRYADFGSNANFFSYCLLAAFPCCLFFYSISVKRSEKMLWLVVMIIMLCTMYTTYTRNVWIGIIIMLFAWNLIRRNYKIFFSLLGFIIIIASLNSRVQTMFSDIHEILDSKDISNLSPKLFSSRTAIWQANLHYFYNNTTLTEKLFGNGFDVLSKVIIPQLKTKEPIPEHNNYLTLLMNTGICGLSLYCFYIFYLFKESFKLLRRAKDLYLKNLAQVCISVLFAYVVVSVFTHIILMLGFQYCFSSFAGLIVAANILEEKKQDTIMVSSNRI